MRKAAPARPSGKRSWKAAKSRGSQTKTKSHHHRNSPRTARPSEREGARYGGKDRPRRSAAAPMAEPRRLERRGQGRKLRGRERKPRARRQETGRARRHEGREIPQVAPQRGIRPKRRPRSGRDRPAHGPAKAKGEYCRRRVPPSCGSSLLIRPPQTGAGAGAGVLRAKGRRGLRAASHPLCSGASTTRRGRPSR